MKSQSKTLHIKTSGKQGLTNVTDVLREAVDASGINAGFVGVYSQHTTAAVLVSEFQAALNDDVLECLKRIVEDGLPYKHNSPDHSDCDRKNAAAHLRSMLLSHGVVLPVADGKPVLGQFQSVILAELDGPRDRQLQIHVMGM